MPLIRVDLMQESRMSIAKEFELGGKGQACSWPLPHFLTENTAPFPKPFRLGVFFANRCRASRRCGFRCRHRVKHAENGALIALWQRFELLDSFPKTTVFGVVQ